MRKLFIAMWIMSLAAMAVAEIPSGGSPKKAAVADLDDSTPTSLPAKFEKLNRRSIFLKGVQTIENSTGSNATPTSTPYQSTEAASQQAVLIFNGVTQADGRLTAFIENKSTGEESLKHIGDEMAMGKISDITFDGETWQLDFQTSAGITHVKIGQNMQGVVPVATASIVPTTQAAGSTSAPGNER